MISTVDFAKKIKELGGTAYLVGGCIRDAMLGFNAKDWDFVITGVEQEDFIKEFPDAILIGKAFPVYLMEIGYAKSEVAFARKEKKKGNGRHGFEVQFDKKVTIKEDLYRRDITINAMAYDILTDRVIDPFGGKRDLANRVARAVSEHFKEDSLRILRVARLSAKYNLTVTEDTYKLMRSCAKDLLNLPRERINTELMKAMETTYPSKFFEVLHLAHAIHRAFPTATYLAFTNNPTFIQKLNPLRIKSEKACKAYVIYLLDLLGGNRMLDGISNKYIELEKLSRKLVKNNQTAIMNQLKNKGINYNDFFCLLWAEGNFWKDVFRPDIVKQVVELKVDIPKELKDKEISEYKNKKQFEFLKGLVEKYDL